ncbi:MAG: KOW motif-containing protein [Spirochaetes bacterium]|nr:KOW motif-containing protein [Spirochaetota bacterium]
MNNKDKWFVLQVLSNRENKIVDNIGKMDLPHLRPFLPQKKIKIKKLGVVKDVIVPLYPGYIFILGTWVLEEAKKILQIQYTVKFIGGINNPGYLKKDEIDLINKIARDGICNYSKVVSEGNKIKVISGPLKELEGQIISVDRRKQRAVVFLPLLNTNVKVTLGFEFMEIKN